MEQVTAVGSEVNVRLDREEATVRRELDRAETKAGLVISAASMLLPVMLAGAALASLGPAAVRLVLAAGVVDVLAVAAAAVVIVPRLGGRRGGWPSRIGLTGTELLARLAAADERQEHADQVAFLHRLAAAKFRLVLAAVGLLLAAVVLLLAAGIAAVL